MNAKDHNHLQSRILSAHHTRIRLLEHLVMMKPHAFSRRWIMSKLVENSQNVDKLEQRIILNKNYM